MAQRGFKEVKETKKTTEKKSNFTKQSPKKNEETKQITPSATPDKPRLFEKQQTANPSVHLLEDLGEIRQDGVEQPRPHRKQLLSAEVSRA